MPEGPEIRRAADRIASVLEGKRVESVEFGLANLKPFQRRLTDCKVKCVETHGKAMLTRFDNGLTLYSHNQLYGRWYTTKRPKLPQTNRSLRVALHTDTHSALLYSASDIEVLSESQLALHPFLSRIGPDILDATLTASAVKQRLLSTSFRRRAVGGLYLDQVFLAGNGNYLRSEVLFMAGIEPSRKPQNLSAQELDKLAQQTLIISRRSYRTRGVTVAAQMAKSLKAGGSSFGKLRFYVFGREGLPCRICETTIVRRTMSSRNVFLCPTCQPKVTVT